MTAIPLLALWPKVLRECYEERICIKLDSGIELPAAESQALNETWERRFDLDGTVRE